MEEARNIQPYNSGGSTTASGGSLGYSIPPGMQAYYPGGHYRYHGSQAPQYVQAPPGSTVYVTPEGPVVVDQYGMVVYIWELHVILGMHFRDLFYRESSGLFKSAAGVPWTTSLWNW